MYIYKITNLINNKIYIGQSTLLSEKSKYYLGSGLYISRAIKKYGKENFKKEILINNLGNQLWLDYYEEYYIKYFNSLVPLGYNIAKKSKGHGKWSDETKLKMSKAKIGTVRSEETKQKISIAGKGRKSVYQVWLEKYGKEEADIRLQNFIKKRKIKMVGFKHTQESKLKMSLSHKNISEETKQKIGNGIKNSEKYQLAIKNPNRNKKISIATKGKSNFENHLHSEKTKEKMSEIFKSKPKIKCPHCQKEMYIQHAKQWHFNNCKIGNIDYAL